MAGAAPRQSDGRFTNPIGDLGHGTFGVRFPFMLRRIGGAFRTKPNPPALHADRTAHFRAGDPMSASGIRGGPVARATWIGHATLLVELDGVRFLTDPTWSDTASPLSFAGPRRFVPPGIDFDALPPIDFVVVSHDHYDHLDLGTLERLHARDPETWFYVPLGMSGLLENSGIDRIKEFDWTDSVTHDGVVVHCLPAKHWSRRSLTDTHRRLWSSWAVVGPTRRFFFAGDTGLFEGFAEIGRAHGPFDLVAVPIGAYAPRKMMEESHMNPRRRIARPGRSARATPSACTTAPSTSPTSRSTSRRAGSARRPSPRRATRKSPRPGSSRSGSAARSSASDVAPRPFAMLRPASARSRAPIAQLDRAAAF